MKIALLGNMNNNNFSIMRYFRDLGADAHLLLWDNDGKGSLSHFAPECDTWEIEKWSPYIHQTKLQNAFTSLIPDPRSFKLPTSKKYILEVLDGYDKIIGSGIAPALLDRVGKKLDVFYPYTTGVEFVGVAPNNKSISSESLLRRAALKYVRGKQINGIRRSQYCLNSELGPTQETLAKIGKQSLPLAIPMIYNRETLDSGFVKGGFTGISEKILAYDFRVLSHGRQLWKNDECYTQSDWQGRNKNNDWLIRGFAEFLNNTPKVNPLLILLEYGPDVLATKELCRKLCIDENVLWLPVMARKEIMYLLGLCHVGVGEFTAFPGCVWGGTGWEVLSSGKPLLQTFNFSQEEFVRSFGHEPPPILDVKTAADVTRHLVDWCENKDRYIKLGHDAREWFNTYNGIGLAKRWLDLLRAPQQ